jgi:hypothetical protein
MSNPFWFRAYLVVLAVAFPLVSFAVFVAAATTASIVHLSREMGMFLAHTTEFYAWLGTPGFVTLGIGTLVLIVALARWRNAAWAVLFSAGSLVMCVLICLHAALASHYPFWGVTWRLSK